MRNISKKGIGLVEVMIGASIVLLSVVAAASAIALYSKLASDSKENIQATYLAEEGIEAIKILRDGTWSSIDSLTLGDEYGIYFDGYHWATSSSASIIDEKYTRSFVVNSVYRDINNNISPSGTLDPQARKVTVTVTWQNGSSVEAKSLSAYVMDLFDN